MFPCHNRKQKKAASQRERESIPQSFVSAQIMHAYHTIRVEEG